MIKESCLKEYKDTVALVPHPRFDAATLTLLTQIQGGCTCVASLAAWQSLHSAENTNLN